MIVPVTYIISSNGINPHFFHSPCDSELVNHYIWFNEACINAHESGTRLSHHLRSPDDDPPSADDLGCHRGPFFLGFATEEPDEAAVKKYEEEAEKHSTLDFVMGIAP